MQLRSIAVVLASTAACAGATLASGLPAAPALASFTQPARASTGAARGASSVTRTASLAGSYLRNGAITGVVDGAGGRALTGVCVAAAGPGGTTSTITRAGGRYLLVALRPGGYVLHFSACAADGGYAGQWSGGSSWPQHAAVVTVAAGQLRQVDRVTLRYTPAAPPAAPPAAVRIRAIGRAFAASSAITSSTGGIAGTVTGNGQPLSGICVSAFGPGHGMALTSQAGKYQIGKLKPGRYTVQFVAGQYCGKNTGNWLPQWYRGITSPLPPRHPTRVAVTAGKVTGGVDAGLRLGGEITGITRSKSGKVLAGVCVIGQGQLGRTGVGFGTESARNGRYAVHSLFQGRYLVEFTPSCGVKGNYALQWYKNSANQAHARPISISGTRIASNIDAALAPGAVVSGVVRSQATNALLGGICVAAEAKQPGSPVPYEQAQTAANGSYRLTGLVTGRYQITFNTGCGNNGNYLQVVRPVSVITSHVITGFDALLPPGAIVSGVVTDAHGNPVRGICVDASNNSPLPSDTSGAATTAADGSYSIGGLSTGSYTMQFSGGCGNAGSYAEQYYDGQVNIGSANPVALTAGQTSTGIGAAMQPGGTITGKVTDAAGHPLSHVCVLLTGSPQLGLDVPFYLQFSKNGSYQVTDLNPGLYAVNFGCIIGIHGYAPQWFKSQLDPSTANLVSAAPGVVTSGVGAVMKRGGFITGVVTNGAHQRLSGICVAAALHGHQIVFLKLGSTVRVTVKGVYKIGPLTAGRYDVQFQDCNKDKYATQWYRASSAQRAATPVVVRNGITTSGIGAVLAGGGSISGQVLGGSNQPLANICVTATDAAAQSTGATATSSTGRYIITNLNSGDYQVTFSDCGFGKHHILLGTASRMAHVTAPHAVTGFNEHLTRAGSITGLVLGGGAATPQSSACVVVVPLSPGGVTQSTITGNDGKYQVTALAPGKYQVYFGDPFCFFAGGGYAPQWFSDQPTQATATRVTVTSGGNTSGINATLAADGGIAGVVTGQSHAPVAGECVTAVPDGPSPDPLSGETLHPVIAVTGADGSYALIDLLPGRYKVEFSAGCGDTGYATQWWNDAASAATATVITVAASAAVSGIDATLQP